MTIATPDNLRRSVQLPNNSASWREHLAVRLVELRARVARLADSDFRTLAEVFLDGATDAVEHRPDIRSAWSGADVERAWVSTHAAQVAIVRGSSLEALLASLPSLVEDCAAVI